MDIDALAKLAVEAETEQPQTLANQSGFDQATFLRIFLVQLEHQDPLDPQDASDMSVQLAQFSQVEQAIRSAEELRSIGGKLDELIAATEGRSSFSFDPVALIGKEIGFHDNALRIDPSGSSGEILIDLPSGATALSIEVQDQSGAPIALGVITGPAGPGDTTRPLEAGTYRLRLIDGVPHLTGPAGTSDVLSFSRLVRGDDGRLVIDPNVEGNPFEFLHGTLYQFAVTGSDPTREPFQIDLSTTGTVEAVRIADGEAVLSVDGRDVNTSSIVRIR